MNLSNILNESRIDLQEQLETIAEIEEKGLFNLDLDISDIKKEKGYNIDLTKFNHLYRQSKYVSKLFDNKNCDVIDLFSFDVDVKKYDLVKNSSDNDIFMKIELDNVLLIFKCQSEKTLDKKLMTLTEEQIKKDLLKGHKKLELIYKKTDDYIMKINYLALLTLETKDIIFTSDISVKDPKKYRLKYKNKRENYKFFGDLCLKSTYDSSYKFGEEKLNKAAFREIEYERFKLTEKEILFDTCNNLLGKILSFKFKKHIFNIIVAKKRVFDLYDEKNKLSFTLFFNSSFYLSNWNGSISKPEPRKAIDKGRVKEGDLMMNYLKESGIKNPIRAGSLFIIENENVSNLEGLKSDMIEYFKLKEQI